MRVDVPPEHREVVGAGVARGHDGRRALEGDQLVGGNADRRPIREDVRVQIDQAGHDDLPFGVQHAVRALRRNVGLDRLDEAEANADVALRP